MIIFLDLSLYLLVAFTLTGSIYWSIYTSIWDNALFIVISIYVNYLHPEDYYEQLHFVVVIVTLWTLAWLDCLSLQVYI